MLLSGYNYGRDCRAHVPYIPAQIGSEQRNQPARTVDRMHKEKPRTVIDGLGLFNMQRLGRADDYLSSTVAPASSNWALALSASSFLAPSRTALGAPSTRALASARPRLVMALTALMT